MVKRNGDESDEPIFRDWSRHASYAEGHRYFMDYGHPRDECPDAPYKRGDRKIAWLCGWLDARTEASLRARKGARSDKRQAGS